MSQHPQNRTESDVARLVAEIDSQYQSAQMALTGLNFGTAQHAFITARLERIGLCHEQLIDIVGKDAADILVIQQMDKSADNKGEN